MTDGGFRRGSDILKALSLGATAAFAGRPFMYAAAVGGQQGVSRAVQLLHDEAARNTAMLGITILASLDPSFLINLPAHPEKIGHSFSAAC
jgi:L-lactate dehydrogenase (cytochrome)